MVVVNLLSQNPARSAPSQLFDLCREASVLQASKFWYPLHFWDPPQKCTSSWNQTSRTAARLIYASGCSCLWSSEHFCRTNIAQGGKHMAQNTNYFYLKIFSALSLVHRKGRLSWSSGWMPICINIAWMSAVTATEYYLRRGSLQSRSSAVSKASLSEIPSYFETAFVIPQILSGFCRLINGWRGRYQTKCLKLGSAVEM